MERDPERHHDGGRKRRYPGIQGKCAGQGWKRPGDRDGQVQGGAECRGVFLHGRVAGRGRALRDCQEPPGRQENLGARLPHQYIINGEEITPYFLEEKKYQEQFGLKCTAVIDGYTDFIFINRFGGVQHQVTLNKAIRRIIRNCNDKQLESGVKNPILLPPFSCHSLRHTFTTRMIEANINVKVVQEVLGHKDVSTTLDIYTDVTKELAQREFENLDEKLKENGHKLCGEESGKYM